MKFRRTENENDLLITNRINSIESIDSNDEYEPRYRKRRRMGRSQKRTIFIALGIAAIVIVAFFSFIYLSREKPGGFMAQLTGSTSSDSSPVDITLATNMQSENEHIKRGVESYLKKYYRDAAAEFNEVVESNASDKDKAIALTYLGMISLDAGDYPVAEQYFRRALSFDNNNVEIYKRLALVLRYQKQYDKAVDFAKQSIAKEPSNVDSRILLGNIFFEMNQYGDAIEQYKKALEQAPENATVLYNLATALIKTGDDFAAAEYLKRAAAADKFGDVAYRAASSLGVLYTEKGDVELAEKYLKQAVSIRPNNPVNRYNLGVAYLRAGKEQEALHEFSLAEEYAEGEEKMLENLGDMYSKLSRFDKSAAVYEKVLQNNNRNVRILARVGEIYYKNGDLDRAFDSYKKITMIEPASENARNAYLNMGNILDDAQRYDEAAENYQKALSLNAKDDAAYYNLGLTYQHAGKPEMAIAAWKESARLNTTNPAPRLAIANYYYEAGFFDLAEKEYQDILQSWPNIQEGHFKMGSLYYKQHQYSYAYKAFERAAKVDVNSELARKSYVNMALINSELNPDEHGIDESINLVQKALLIKPGDPEALLSFGILLGKKGQSDRAIDTFYQIIKNTTDSKLIAQAYNNIGKTHYKQQDYKKAVQAFSRAVEEDPSNEEIRINRKTASQAYEQEISSR